MNTIILNMILKLQILIMAPASWLDEQFQGICVASLETIFDTSEFKAPIGGLYLVLNESGSGTGTLYQSLWATVQSITTKTIMPIGVALVTTFFIMSLVDMASKDNTTLEHYIKEFIKLIIAVTIVTKSWPIILYLLKISEFVLKDIGAMLGDFNVTDSVDKIINDHDKWGGWISLWFTSLLPWLIKKIAVVALYVCVFMRVLDVTWRAALFPIGAANLFEGGVNSPGVKYIKSFFGALLSGAMIMLILAISPPLLDSAYVMAGGDANVAAGMLAITGAEFAIVGAAFGASSKVKEVFS